MYYILYDAFHRTQKPCLHLIISLSDTNYKVQDEFLCRPSTKQGKYICPTIAGYLLVADIRFVLSLATLSDCTVYKCVCVCVCVDGPNGRCLLLLFNFMHPVFHSLRTDWGRILIWQLHEYSIIN